MTVYDWSFANVTPAQLEAAGAEGWVRYIASDRRKTITVDELAGLHDAGLPGALVHEEGASWRSWNSSTANRLADLLDWPDTRPIYYAADTDLDPSEYPAVADTLAAMTGRPRGIYGESGLVEHCLDAGAASHGWLTAATSWSHAPAPGACLRQLAGASPIAGTDANAILAPDWGQHPLTIAPTPAPTPPEEEVQGIMIRTTDDGGTIVVLPGGGAKPWIAHDPAALGELVKAHLINPVALDEADAGVCKALRAAATP